MNWRKLRVSSGSYLGATFDGADYSEISVIGQVWKETYAELSHCFDRLTEEELAAASSHDAPIKDKSLRGTITFFAYHESCHIGQMASVRQWLGRGGLIDG